MKGKVQNFWGYKKDFEAVICLTRLRIFVIKTQRRSYFFDLLEWRRLFFVPNDALLEQINVKADRKSKAK
jgi:hypothetical protein